MLYVSGSDGMRQCHISAALTGSGDGVVTPVGVVVNSAEVSKYATVTFVAIVPFHAVPFVPFTVLLN